MNSVSLILFFISVFGFLTMSFLPIFFSIVLQQILLFTRSKKNSPQEFLALNKNSPLKLHFLIPVHNQAEELSETLKSIQALQNSPGYEIQISVGANACTDQTIEIAQKGNVTLLTQEVPSKWLMLKDLISSSKSDWAILVDAGTLLPIHFCELMNFQNTEEHIFSIAPRYFPQKIGFLKKMIWLFESIQKWLENFAGGPISLHGACIAYRTLPIQQALTELDKVPVQKWLTDDVALPLWLRILFPDCQIHYQFFLCIDDAGIRLDKTSSNRRRRMLQGNLDWIWHLWPKSLTANPVVAGLALRRMTRLLWAWWCTFFGIALAIHISVESPSQGVTFVLQALGLGLVLLLLIKKSYRKNELMSAYVSSLLFFRDLPSLKKNEIDSRPWR